MNILEIIKKVETSDDFIDISELYEDLFLAHVFIMLDGDKLMDTQVGYYNPDNSKMTSFVLSDDEIQCLPETDVFQKPGTEIESVNKEHISLEFDEIKKLALGILSEKYKQSPSKQIYILQNVQSRQVWNVTFLTNGFSTINVKIDSSSGEIVSHEEVNLVDFKK